MKYLKLFESVDVEDIKNIFIDLISYPTHRMCDIGYSYPKVNLSSQTYPTGYRVCIKFEKIKETNLL